MKQTILQVALFLLFAFSASYGTSQANLSQPNAIKTDSISTRPVARQQPFRDGNGKKVEVQEKDLGDLIHVILHGKDNRHTSTEEKRDTRKHFSIVPGVGYTLQTGWAGVISANLGYYNDTLSDSKLSSINSSITYSQYKQTIVPFIANIWTKGNQYNFITDLRFISYPSSIYGLGGRTDPNKGVTINFTGLKIHETLMRAVSGNVYLGVGYFYDHFWKISAVDQVSRNVNTQITRELGASETASGPVFRLLYDSRINQINPQQGNYYSITYRSNLTSTGSDSSSEELRIDARTYLHFPENSKNVLAFWMLDWLTLNGTPPYLLLPSTGWDENFNTGRGYIQGRFRGRKMLYFESEYRFGITRNSLLGGVMFANLQNFSSDLSREYSGVFAGYGLGARIRLNKSSRTNLAIDYGFGKNASHGFFVNLGEVF